LRPIPKAAALALASLAVVASACTGISGGDAPLDRAFIDMMVPHHESAIAMAEIAQERAEHPELRQLADDVVAAQSAEISQLKDWRLEWFGSADTPSMEEMPMLPGMSMPAGHTMSGGAMDMTEEVDGLRDADPFDRFFIDAMIRHHEQAVEAANIVLAETERDEVRGLAEDIIEAQTREIEQLRDWRAEWY
jgi:uncharacterized protein (DUF305 family)